MHRLLRNLKLLSAIGFALVILLIWFFGHAFGLISTEQRLTAVIAVMIVWVVALLIGRFFTMRAGVLVERMFRAQLDRAVMQATPEQRGEIALLRKQLLEAISTLKKSNLGRTRGKAALYELPWYMIIGHPAAGKSSAIQNSGLTFPISENGKGAIKGVGGTRNCDWFFTSEGVLLDTAGRYSVQAEDRAEWLEFLRLLKSHRPRTPVNGILVAISLPELAQYKSEGFAEYARQIRARINEIDQAFSRKVPVYLFFTKIDLLGGFTQFFEDLSDEQRSQVWGATLSHEQADKHFDVAKLVTTEFEQMFRGLVDIGNDKLANNRGNGGHPAFFAFPIEFNSIRNAVSRFVEILFEDDPYHTHPLLRGFYFTSALQEGVPRIPAGTRVSEKFSLQEMGFPAQRASQSQSYFLRDVFRDVIFPDQYLIGRQVKGSWSLTRWAGLCAGFLLLCVVSGAWGWSFYQNQKLVGDISKELTLFDSGGLSDRLTRLNFIQIRLEELANEHPSSMGLGLYQGDEVTTRLEQLYRTEIEQILLAPVKQNLEAQLGLLTGSGESSAGSAVLSSTKFTNEQQYDALKTYLMMHQKERMEAPYFADQLMVHWRDWLEQSRGKTDSESIVPLAEHIVGYYVKNFSRPTTPIIDIDAKLVTDARAYLNSAIQKLPLKDRIYKELLTQAASKYPALTLSRILENTDTDLMSGSYTVPPAYTRAAWDGHIRQAIDEISRGTLKENDWVLENGSIAEQMSSADFEQNRTELMAMYKADYAAEWRKFVGGLSINGFKGIDDSISRLERLSDFKQSAIRKVFARISYETSWDNPDLLEKSLPKQDQNIKDAIVNRLLADKDLPVDQQGVREIGELEEKFSLFARLTSEKNGAPTITPYLGALGKMKSRLEAVRSSGEAGKSARALMKNTADSSGSELVEGIQIVDGQLLAGADTGLREVLKPMLLRPFNSSYGALIPLANADINQNWQRLVYPYWQALSDKYPFIDSTNEAQLADISKFLSIEEGVLNKFINEQLSGLLVRQGNTYVPRRWANMSVAFNKDFLSGISRASDIQDKVFIAGGQSQFEMQPVPTTGLSEVVLEVDGQQLRYRNGPQLWTQFSWPSGQVGQGAKISIITFSGVSSTVASAPGRMGWTRLVSQAKASTVAPGVTQLTWMVASPDNKSGEKIAIKFNLRQVSGANLLAVSMLRDLNLPKKIVN
ncbi:MAG: type VI secretion system membrane subunit TssM [Spongiibacteraceae bacterium]